jgi:hypothetical protein
MCELTGPTSPPPGQIQAGDRRLYGRQPHPHLLKSPAHTSSNSLTLPLLANSRPLSGEEVLQTIAEPGTPLLKSAPKRN